jgi:hypothetical protein
MWQLWYFFANDPEQGWATPMRQVPSRVKLSTGELQDKIEEALDEVSGDGSRVTIVDAGNGWDQAPTLWLHLEIEDPMMLYKVAESTILALQDAIGEIDLHELAYYIIDERWRYIALVPVVRGKMIDSHAWRLFTLGTILGKPSLEAKIWLFMPQYMPDTLREEQQLILWDHHEIALANRLSATTAELSLQAAQLSDFRELPHLSEAGRAVLEFHVSEQATELSSSLESVLSVITAISNEFSQLPAVEPSRRSSLTEAMGGLIELNDLVLPSESYDDEQALTADEMVEYAKRLEQSRPLAEGIRLAMIADALDNLGRS